MILFDTSVWIDLFADRRTAQTAAGRDLIAAKSPVAVGDLILTEILQGTRDERDLQGKLAALRLFDQVAIVDGAETVVAAARNYHRLRVLGVTPRKTIDTLIATRCIVSDFALLYTDRDFDPFVRHLGLRSALPMAGVH